MGSCVSGNTIFIARLIEADGFWASELRPNLLARRSGHILETAPGGVLLAGVKPWRVVSPVVPFISPLIPHVEEVQHRILGGVHAAHPQGIILRNGGEVIVRPTGGAQGINLHHLGTVQRIQRRGNRRTDTAQDAQTPRRRIAKELARRDAIHVGALQPGARRDF